MKRLRFAGVHPVELWDAPCRGGILQDFRHDARLAEALAEVVRDLPGRLATAHGARAAPARAAASIAHVHLLGGGVGEALRAQLAARLSSRMSAAAPAGTPAPICSLGTNATFAAAHAGLRRLHELHAAQAPLAVDVGQTSLKVCSARGSWRVERDLERAPLRHDVDEASALEARRRTRAFVSEVVAAHGPCDALLVALPSELLAEGRLGPCTYAWGDDDAWLTAVAERAGAGARLAIANDAELAGAAWLDVRTAAPAAASAPAAPGESAATLVLTAGYGIGAALVEPR